MPAIYRYVVTQTRQVEVTAENLVESIQKAQEEFDAYGVADNPKVKELSITSEKTL